MTTYFVAFNNFADSMGLAEALLQNGVSPEDLSVVADPAVGDIVFDLDPEDDANLYVENDLTIDSPGRERRIDFLRTGDPATEPAIDFMSEHRGPLHESVIGGGISTATADDAVSGVEEMDDSQAVAEMSMYRADDRDSREREEAEFDESPEAAAATNIGDIHTHDLYGTGIEGADEGTGVGILAALLPTTVQGVGTVLGEGLLASELLSEEADDRTPDVLSLLKRSGVEERQAIDMVKALEAGGSILAVTAVEEDERVASVVEGFRGQSCGYAAVELDG